MPATLDRPKIDVTHVTDEAPLIMWNLLLLKSDKRRVDITEILLKIFPFNENRLETVFNDLRAHKVALLWVDAKEVVQEYSDILKAAELPVRIEPEV